MLQITEQEMLDYIYCPTYYDIKYNSKIDLKEQPTLKILLNKIAKYFYFHMLNGKICTMNELKTKWDQICSKHADVIDQKKNLEGIGLIHKMLLWASREHITILDIETKYAINTQTVELTGNLPAITSPREGQYEILITDFSNRLQEPSMLNMNLKYTLSSYGFKCAYNQDPLGIKIHNIKNNKDIKTIRKDNDYLRLRSAIESVGYGIKNNVFYPRELNCHKCAAYDYCRYWNKETRKDV